MQELLDRIASATGVSTDTARRAVEYILAYMTAESDDPAMDEMIDATPGAREAAGAASQDDGGSFAGAGIMALGSKLMGLGLDMGQIRAVAEELVAHSRAHAGEDTVNRAIASVPALAQFV